MEKVFDGVNYKKRFTILSYIIHASKFAPYVLTGKQIQIQVDKELLVMLWRAWTFHIIISRYEVWVCGYTD